MQAKIVVSLNNELCKVVRVSIFCLSLAASKRVCLSEFGYLHLSLGIMDGVNTRGELKVVKNCPGLLTENVEALLPLFLFYRPACANKRAAISN